MPNNPQKKCEEEKHKAIPLEEGRFILAWDARCEDCKHVGGHKPTKKLLYQEIPSFPTESTTKCDHQGRCLKDCPISISLGNMVDNSISPTQPDTPHVAKAKTLISNIYDKALVMKEISDTESWEEELSRKFFEGELSWNGSRCLISIPPLIEFIHQVEEKAYQRGWEEGNNDAKNNG